MNREQMDALNPPKKKKLAKIVKRPRIHDPEQDSELERVSERIAAVVIDFFNEHGPGYEFNLHEITLYVMQKVVCSPTSPYRVMADLRKKDRLNYIVMSRKESLYRMTAIAEEYNWDGNLESVFDDLETT